MSPVLNSARPVFLVFGLAPRCLLGHISSPTIILGNGLYLAGYKQHPDLDQRRHEYLSGSVHDGKARSEQHNGLIQYSLFEELDDCELYAGSITDNDSRLTEQVVNYITNAGAHAVIDPHNYGR
jgi:hypothetical protein